MSIKMSLLTDIWNKIISYERSDNPYIKAVTKVAYYQPEQALNFAKKRFRRKGEFERITSNTSIYSL